MSSPEQAIRQALSQVVPDALGIDLLTAGAVRSLDVTPQQVSLAVRLGFPCDSQLPWYRRCIEEALAPVLGDRVLELSLDWQVASHRPQGELTPLATVRNVIAVSSGKGGVGKSTTAANLALALAREGARVGVLDGDIYGPSMPIMLGIPEATRPQVREQKYFVPLRAHGLDLMSIGFLIEKDSPIVWRGPKASGALQQLIRDTLWDDLDYLVVDLPPGTSDIHLTLAQRVPVAGAVVVTTPQEVALADARKGIEMFRKVDVPVLGVVENMAVHVCSQCGHADHLFGEGGGERLARDYDTVLLGSLPLLRDIREQADAGRPTLVSAPEGPEAATYLSMARRLAARLSQRPQAARTIVRMAMADPGSPGER